MPRTRIVPLNLSDTELIVDVAGWAGPGHRLAALTPRA